MSRFAIRSALAFFLIACLLASPVNAHFIWVYHQDGKIKVVFGEGLEPDQSVFLGGLKSMKAYRVVQGKRELVEFAKEEAAGMGWFEKSCDKVGHAVDVHCQYGVFGRGDTKMLLDYGAKYVNLDHTVAAKPGGELKLDLIPVLEGSQLKLTAYFEGKPVEGVEVELERMPLDQSMVTDQSGSVSLQCGSRFVIRGKHTISEGGELNGDKYDEKRYYCTLVVDTGSATSKAKVSKKEKTADTKLAVKQVDAGLADFPKGMTSFGADVVDGRIFVIGGKSGRAHSYAKSYQNREVFCLSTNGDDQEWKTVTQNHGLQGLAVVGYKGKIYRIGGLEARNKEGEDHDLHSVADVKVFDPKSGAWSDLPAMPTPRSSLDACVAGNHVYVVGGWAMGDGDSKWADKMVRYDLSQEQGTWEEIEVPFRTRALAVECWKNKIVVLGGIQQQGGPTSAVHIYDIATGKWSEGPEIVTAGRMKAFGCSCVVLKDRLFVSTYDGGIYELEGRGQKWQKVHQLDDGRFFHQMVPLAEDRFALVGGAHMESGSHYEVEAFELQD